MESIDVIRPSKAEQRAAMESYDALAAALEQLHSDNPEIEIEETEERIKIPWTFRRDSASCFGQTVPL